MGHMLLCEDVRMTWDLEEVINEQQARAREREAITKEARHREWVADMRLGRAIARARHREVPQRVISDEMKLSREQVRRLENAWHAAVADGRVSDADLDN